ncbi:MAG: permease-like cell division protein FtsX [Gammaproteobacteria bacterium]|nr:permease-like cell division protein FtsX [Gammaproteobacteria bacterium]
MKQNLRQRSSLISYGLRHIQAGFSSLGQLSRAPFATFITCLVIGITLALPVALFTLLKNVDVLGQKLEQNTQITLYLKPNVDDAEAAQFLKELKSNHSIAEAHAISPTAGLAELQQQAGVTNMLSELQDNPLPWAIVIVPAKDQQTPRALNALSNRLKELPLVAEVQLDSAWIERLFAILSLAHRMTYALAFFLGMAVLLIVNNCIRAATQLHQKEIDIIKLIGGTRAFIRRPFLYAGMIYGLLGGIIACLLVDLFLLWLKSPISHLTNLYQSQFHILGLNGMDTLLLLFCSLTLGWIGSWVAATRYLLSRRV